MSQQVHELWSRRVFIKTALAGVMFLAVALLFPIQPQHRHVQKEDCVCIT